MTLHLTIHQERPFCAIMKPAIASSPGTNTWINMIGT